MSKLMWVLILQGLVALCALYPSLKPIEKTAGRVALFVLTFFLLFASAYLAVAMDRESSAKEIALKKQLDTIQRNTEQPPNVVIPPQKLAPRTADVSMETFRGCWFGPTGDDGRGADAPDRHMFIIGKAICVNFFFHATGTAPAEQVKTASAIYVVTTEPEEQVLQEFAVDKTALQARASPTTMASKGFPDFSTAMTNGNLTDEIWQKLADGSARLYIMAAVDYTDPAGSHSLHVCRELQRPSQAQPPKADESNVWHYCDKYPDHY
jgi:hypothetical protein